MKPIEQWGGDQVAMSNREGTAEHAARMATVVRLRENMTAPETKRSGIDWGIVAVWAGLVVLGAAFWAWFLATFAPILGG